jgi:hypothetical protein
MNDNKNNYDTESEDNDKEIFIQSNHMDKTDLINSVYTYNAEFENKYNTESENDK